MSETAEQKRARWRSVAIGQAKDMPTRSSEASGQWERMARWEKEHDAFRTLAKNGRASEVDNLAEAPAKVKELGG